MHELYFAAVTFYDSLWKRAGPSRVPWTRVHPCPLDTFLQPRRVLHVHDIADPTPVPNRMWPSTMAHSKRSTIHVFRHINITN